MGEGCAKPATRQNAILAAPRPRRCPAGCARYEGPPRRDPGMNAAGWGRGGLRFAAIWVRGEGGGLWPLPPVFD
jgi:hypothetical protein